MNATVTRAYEYALDPSPAQVRDLERHAGAARFAFNWALAAVKVNLAQRAAERTYGVSEQELTPSLGWNLPALRRVWNDAKPMAAPWWAECSKEGSRNGRRAGFPRFRSRRRTVPSVRFTTGAIRVERDRRHVTLPRVMPEWLTCAATACTS